MEKCNENIDEKKLQPNKIIYNSALNDYKEICNSCDCISCKIHVVFLVMFL